MKLAIDLKYDTPEGWVDVVLADFDLFLQDHADCERKASSMAMSFVAKCPDRSEIIPQLIETAIEELEHFEEVYKIMAERGVSLPTEMTEDQYIKKLLHLCRSDRDDRLLDRMLIASIVECRGAERFRLIAEALSDPELKKFYKKLWTSEAKHGDIFVRMALVYWEKEIVYKRLNELMAGEAEICANLEWKPALH